MTLTELLIGVGILGIVSVAVLGAYLSQSVLNEHAQNLSRAAHDANRVLEQIRQDSDAGACDNPSAEIIGGADAWLLAQGPGKSLLLGDPDTEERIFLTCQDEDATGYCGPNQVSDQEWAVGGADTDFNPLRITVTVCWRHRGRVVGECTWDAVDSELDANDVDGDGVIESPVVLTTLLTCRG